jgi:prophage regulatory protein
MQADQVVKLSAAERFLRLPEVIARTGKSRSTIYADMDEGVFPRQHKIGKRACAWLSSDITEWQRKQVTGAQ